MDPPGTVTVATRFEAVYREQGARLQRAILLYAGDDALAQGAVAEAFAQALRRGEAIRDPAAWVWRAAFRIAAGALKDAAREVPASSTILAEGYMIPHDALEVMEALRHLSPKQRGAVVLHHVFGYPAKEAAAILGSTPAAVMVHLSQGRKRLRRLLEAHDG